MSSKATTMTTNTDTTAAPTRRARFFDANLGLSLSAAALVALIAAVAGGSGFNVFGGSTAHAANATTLFDVVSSDDFTLLTAPTSGGGDVICVLDSRTEQLFVYEVEARNRINLLRRESLADLFSSAKRRGPGN